MLEGLGTLGLTVSGLRGLVVQGLRVRAWGSRTLNPIP